MNKVSRLGVRLLSACVIAAASGLAGAQATFVKAQALEVFVDHHEGVVNCQGSATPTGNFFLPCGPEISGTIRGRQVFAAW